MQGKHVVIEKNTPGRWYDNPDISDFMFATFALEDRQTAHPSLCLHTYDKASGKGLDKFELGSDGKWKAKELVESLAGRVLYHPIFTVSTTDKVKIENMFNHILDGIDGVKGNNGTPAVIIIPILMHKNHFGTLAIKPATSGQKAEVYYFNSLGTMAGYANEEKPIFDYMKKRYGINDSNIVTNNTQRWQTDGNQCGPYSIWFVREIAVMVYRGELNKASITKLLQDIWHMGVDNTKGKEKAVKVRENQARILDGLNTNVSVPIFLGFKLNAKRNSKWYEKWDELSFDNPILQKPWEQQKALFNNKVEIRDCAGIDAFELQEETQGLVLTHLQELQSIEVNLKVPYNNENKLQNSFPFYTTIAMCVAGAAIGVLAAYISKTSPDIQVLKKLASYFTVSETTTSVIINGTIGAALGLVSGVTVGCARE
jgi:hypothetical protein